MAASIGIRVYLVTLQKRGEAKRLPFASTALLSSPASFVNTFMASKNTINQDDTLERSWYIEQKSSGVGSSKGYIHYGTFGFESNFIDGKTKKKNYRRKTTDVEEIPLFYEFWFPPGKDYGFAVFQSFQGRSCIQLLMSKIREGFEAANKGYMLIFRRLTPSDKDGGVFNSAPVKCLRLIKKSISSDIADRYLGTHQSDIVDFEISLKAKSRRDLGPLGSLSSSIKNPQGLIVHEGVEFKEAVAEIRVGNRIRRVGVFGSDADTGVIDLSDSVKRGADGHPDFVALSKEVDEILKDFNQSVASAAA